MSSAISQILGIQTTSVVMFTTESSTPSLHQLATPRQIQIWKVWMVHCLFWRDHFEWVYCTILRKYCFTSTTIVSYCYIVYSRNNQQHWI